jgi:hypothetical protein
VLDWVVKRGLGVDVLEGVVDEEFDIFEVEVERGMVM